MIALPMDFSCKILIGSRDSDVRLRLFSTALPYLEILYSKGRAWKLTALYCILFVLFARCSAVKSYPASRKIVAFRSSTSEHQLFVTSRSVHPVYSKQKRKEKHCKGLFGMSGTGKDAISNNIAPSVDRLNGDSTVVNQCRIVCISDPNDANNALLYDNGSLPIGANVVKVICHCKDGSDQESVIVSLLEIIRQERVNTIFVSHESARYLLSAILPRLYVDATNARLPTHPIVWIHSRSAGIDAYTSPELVEWFKNGGNHVQMTNARGVFSSSLAEYCLGACLYFCKDFGRLKENQKNRSWDRYIVPELRGATMGIVGYGDIGRATALLAKAYGMKVLALTRLARDVDPYADEIIVNDVSNEGLNRVFQESDYVVCALPLTPATHRSIGAEQFAVAKSGCVFINVGRGPVVDEDALIAALQPKSDRRLKGAALDVFTIEPLPLSSPLWDMDNLLLSPHNMDQTATFMMESTALFVQEQIPRFVQGEPLLNQVDPSAGY